MNKTYIHYGANHFDPNITKNLNPYKRPDKPSGLWASPEDSDWNWKQWCESEEFHTEKLKQSFRFKLKNGTRVLRIRSLHQAAPFMIETDSIGHLAFYKLNLEKIYSDYDAMEVYMSDDWANLHNNMLFYSWDVDSICVWNPNVIEVIK